MASNSQRLWLRIFPRVPEVSAGNWKLHKPQVFWRFWHSALWGFLVDMRKLLRSFPHPKVGLLSPSHLWGAKSNMVETSNHWLVVILVSWDDYSQYMDTSNKNGPNHQPEPVFLGYSWYILGIPGIPSPGDRVGHKALAETLSLGTCKENALNHWRLEEGLFGD